MKKIIFLNLVALLFACKSNPAVKIDAKPGGQLKGTWNLSAVNYTGSDYIKVNSFEVADSKCFVGSTWKFVSNNNTGEITLNQSSCPAFTTKTTWYINKEGDLIMKFLNEGLKAKKVSQGYFLKVSNQTENSFELIDKLVVGGKASDIVYKFEKIN